MPAHEWPLIGPGGSGKDQDPARSSSLSLLPQQVGELNERWHIVRRRGCRVNDLVELRRLSHMLVSVLTGTGLERAFNGIRRIDERLRHYVNIQVQPPTVEQETIGALIAGLRSIVSEELHERSAAMAPASSIPEQGGVSGTLPSPVIYVVEPDGAPSAELSLQLTAHGFAAQGFANLEPLLDAILKRPPQALVVRVSRSSDPAWLEAIPILKRKAQPSMPVAFVLPCRDIHARLQALRAGCDACFGEPVRTPALAVRLHQLIGTHLPSFRVLILDPEPALLQLYSGILREAGCEVCSTEDPLTLVDLAVDFQPDVILLDPHMPEADGCELCWLLHQEEALLQIPLVFLSAESDVTKHERAIHSCALDLLVEPVSADKLVDRVRSRAMHYRRISGKSFDASRYRGTTALVSAGGGEGRALIGEAIERSNGAQQQRGDENLGNAPQVPSLDDEQRRHWSRLIHTAVTEKRLFLVYQPITSVASTDRMERHEVLLRMTDSEGQLIAPGTFFVIAKQVGLSRLLDRWVVAEALDVLAERQKNGPETSFFIKLSIDSILDDGFVAWFGRTLRSVVVHPHTCVLELCESDVLPNLERVGNLIDTLHDLDVDVAVEHFGVVVDPIRLLQELKPGYMKVDRTLTHELTARPEQRDRLQQLVRQAQYHGVKTMAGYVEDPGDLTALWQSGVALVQGNFLNHPEPEIHDAREP
jgi:EAL domain-containing protein (putative c-di-GMP-specific phosphodiesterase class I)/FixJ family two-component response regulator